ncbi:hypothetical protein, partial [Klebsiella pneumoniae]|uniref:hypothetical protein n=1 Tax=Klebsiella pneumoniae TaxID=573 RepID=UPI003013228D
GSDVADAVAAFNAGWSGAVPYTVLIGMKGDVLFKTQGAMNTLEVRRAILKNLPDDRYVGHVMVEEAVVMLEEPIVVVEEPEEVIEEPVVIFEEP